MRVRSCHFVHRIRWHEDGFHATLVEPQMARTFWVPCFLPAMAGISGRMRIGGSSMKAHTAEGGVCLLAQSLVWFRLCWVRDNQHAETKPISKSPAASRPSTITKAIGIHPLDFSKNRFTPPHFREGMRFESAPTPQIQRNDHHQIGKV